MICWRKNLRDRFPSARAGWIAAGLLCLPVCSAGEPISTGPEVGDPIPRITAPDQYGKVRTFEDLKGPKGLLLLFFRTADW